MLLEEPIVARQFDEWTMGYETVGQASLPDGFRDSFEDLESGDDRDLMVQAARDLTRWFRVRSASA